MAMERTVSNTIQDMACMAWYVFRFFASQSIPLGLHYCNLLFLTGHTAAMIKSLRVDDLFLPTITDINGQVPDSMSYAQTWNANDFGIPANATSQRCFPMPPGTIPEIGTQNLGKDCSPALFIADGWKLRIYLQMLA